MLILYFGWIKRPKNLLTERLEAAEWGIEYYIDAERDRLQLCKDKLYIYHITCLVCGDIFRPWDSTSSRPEKWYSIQCLHFIWAHYWLSPIGAFTEIDVTLLVRPEARISACSDTFGGVIKTEMSFNQRGVAHRFVLHILWPLRSPLCVFVSVSLA